MPNPSGRDDFIVARSGSKLSAGGLPDEGSFVPSYHWACAIDDFDGGYDLLVRSVDLFPVASLQRTIQQWISGCELKYEAPAVFHTALVTQNDGHRLEKRTMGVTLPELEKCGFTANQLLQIFKKSFHSSLSFTSGSLMREHTERLTLSDLGLTT
jgi:glutamyl/glutaminyl-tRNA synthetase